MSSIRTTSRLTQYHVPLLAEDPAPTTISKVLFDLDHPSQSQSVGARHQRYPRWGWWPVMGEITLVCCNHLRNIGQGFTLGSAMILLQALTGSQLCLQPGAQMVTPGTLHSPGGRLTQSLVRGTTSLGINCARLLPLILFIIDVCLVLLTKLYFGLKRRIYPYELYGLPPTAPAKVVHIKRPGYTHLPSSQRTTLALE